MKKFTPTKEWAERFLPAVDELIGFYEQGIESFWCPLCIASDYYRLESGVGCYACPWKVLNGSHCMGDDEVDDYNHYPIKDRLTRLRRWKRKLEEIIAS